MKLLDEKSPPLDRLYTASERLRLVRLCSRLTGDPDAAEDLAQEALIEAWRHAHRLRNPDAWQSWLNGIARNVCLRWQRRQGRDNARLCSQDLSDDQAASAGAGSGEDDLAVDLERAELADVLDRAMGALPPPTRQMLVERYVDDLPPAQIAARWGIPESTAATRLYRGRQALRRILMTDLKAEAAAFGLLDADAPEGQETRIWCPRCGQQRLRARLVSDGDAPHFRSWCPGCGPYVGNDFTSRHPAFDFDRVLGSVRSFKPVLSRVHAWWNQRNRAALSKRQTPCPRCGRPMGVFTTPPPRIPDWLRGAGNVYLVCASCPGFGCIGAHGLALMLPETQRFWRHHPRMRGLPSREIRFENRLALAVAFESVTEPVRIEVVSARDTAEVLCIRTL